MQRDDSIRSGGQGDVWTPELGYYFRQSSRSRKGEGELRSYSCYQPMVYYLGDHAAT